MGEIWHMYQALTEVIQQQQIAKDLLWFNQIRLHFVQLLHLRWSLSDFQLFSGINFVFWVDQYQPDSCTGSRHGDKMPIAPAAIWLQALLQVNSPNVNYEINEYHRALHDLKRPQWL